VPARRSAANPPAAVAAINRWDRLKDGRTLDRYIDLALHTMRAASTQQSEIAVFTYRVQFAVILFDDIRGEYDEIVLIDTDICACLLCEKSDVVLKSGST